jgi:P4 family phage/plasmid primase-like protien
VLHGIGKNGKSTLVELFQDLLGDYSATTTPETLMKQKYGGSNVEYQLAELAHVRFLSVAETKRGAELEEATVKHITGGDTINARSPYGRPFSYRPRFTIWMSTNHKPEIPDGSEAIWDRLRLVPFLKRFEGKKADTKLPLKLRDELPGVLAWAVRGCVEWVDQGLGSAKAVEAATAAYRAETDILEQFFQEKCYFYPKGRVTRKELFKAWEEWCDEMGEVSGTQTSFTRRINEVGIVKNLEEDKSDKNSRGWWGISLSPPKVSEGKKSCKDEGRETKSRHFEENSQNFSTDTLSYGGLLKNDEKVSDLPESVGEPSRPPSEDDYLSEPTTFEQDGLTFEYMPERSE